MTIRVSFDEMIALLSCFEHALSTCFDFENMTVTIENTENSVRCECHIDNPKSYED